MAGRGETSHQRYMQDGQAQRAMVDDLRSAYAGLAQQQLGDLDRVLAAEREQLEQLRRSEAEGKQAAAAREKAWDKAVRDGDRYTATLQRIEAQTRENTRAMKSLTQAAEGFSAVAAKWGSISTGLQSMLSLGKQGFDVVDKWATSSLKAQNVAQNLKLDIRGAREAFKGYVDDVELARIANMAFEFGVVKTGDELAMLAAGVQAKAEKLGQDSIFLFESAALGIGRESRLILDNLGIILDQEKAYKIVAAAAQKTVEDLTALEKAEAFQKAALIEISRAAADAGVSVEGFAASWGKAKISYENFRSEIQGFSDRYGRVSEALRELNNEQLEQLRLGETLERQSAVGTDSRATLSAIASQNKLYDELTGHLDKWNLNLVDLRMAADKLGRSYQDMLKDAMAANDAEDAERELKAIQAENDALAEQKRLEADEAEHTAALLEAQKIDQEVVNVELERAIELRAEAAELAGDEAEFVKQTRALEIFRAKAVFAQMEKKGSGRGRGPTAADRVRAEGEGALIDLEHEITLLGTIAKTEEEIAEVEERKRSLAIQRLALDEKVLDVTKAKNSVERQQQDNRRAEIAAERELILLQAVVAAREEEARWLEEGLAYQRAKIEADANEVDRVVSLEEFRARAAGKRAEEARALAGLGADEVQTIDLDAAAAFANHEARLEQIDREIEAELRKIEVREQLLALENPQTEAERLAWRDEARQIAHDRELARLDQEEQRKQAFAQFEAARAEAEIKRKAAVWKKTQAIAGQSEQLARSGLAVTNLILDETIKDEDARAKAKLKAEGMITIGVAAREAVNAAAAYASLNIPQGIAHTAASVLGFIQGGIMLSGRVPGDHGGGGAAAVGGGGGGGGGRDRETSEAPTVPDSVPAADRGPRRLGGPGTQGQQAGGVTVIINGDLNGVDERYVEDLALKIRQAGYSNEAAA